jgi:predicted nucleic acid-binding protein
MKIYLDNCCFNRPFDAQNQLKVRFEAEAKLAIQAQIKKGALKLVWSYILDMENDDNPFQIRKESIGVWAEIASELVLKNERIETQAMILQKKGLRPKDALHISCAIEASCDVFITTDRKILNKREAIKQIKIMNPIDFFEIEGT